MFTYEMENPKYPDKEKDKVLAAVLEEQERCCKEIKKLPIIQGVSK